MNLTDTINYQKDAVVSKQLLKKETGTVTTFAFDKGQGLSEHTAPYDALVLITDGVAQITISGKKHKVKSGEMILMPADSTHSLKALESFKMILIMIKSK